MYSYGLIGNCQIAALVSLNGSLDWLCLPRPDSAPVFGRLLDPEGGSFSVSAAGVANSRQVYIPNTAVLTTLVSCEDGSEFKITDFCPRFFEGGKIFRPISLFRVVEPVKGSPQITVKCQPVKGWDKNPIHPIEENGCMRFDVNGDVLRLTTNMPVAYIGAGSSFLLKETLYFGLTWGSGIEGEISSLTHRLLLQTLDYWTLWVKHCSIPRLYQKETIRSAITLKLHCYEDTGAILAALTTSLPEENGTGRNWDYRFCWLRDAYFILSAFHNLGHFEEMEGFLKFLLNIAEKHDHSRERLRPVYRLDHSLPLPEVEHANWSGFDGNKPVRSGNQAAEHTQNDVYGEMVLTLAPIFMDERFQHLRTADHERLIEHLVKLCAKNISMPDAGLWEFRNGWQEHSFSNLMSWAAIDRIQQIQELGFLGHLNLDLAKEKRRAEVALCAAVKDGSLRNGPKDESLDAALLQLATLGFPDQELCHQTVEKIWSQLRMGEAQFPSNFLFRYLRKDDFGHPKSAFLICSFWLIQALVRVGRHADARTVMADTVTAANPLGLFSEHFFPAQKRHAGNFPQAYSHVGQINAAFAISPPWSEVFLGRGPEIGLQKEADERL